MRTIIRIASLYVLVKQLLGGNSMEVRSKKVIKTLIELAPNVEEADKVINENYNFKSMREKIAFLKGMFDVKLISKHDSDGTTEEMSAEMDYWSMLNSIILIREIESIEKEIIVVDDNKMFLEILKDFVEGINKTFKCIAFSNPEDALRYMLEKKEIYAVISDYEMLQMNGITLAKRIIEELPATKVIVMSGHDTNYLRKQALNAGVDENKIRLLCKSDIINLSVILNS